MEATYDAISQYGYSDLTIQNIADEFDHSKTLIYYHYDGRDELLVDFLSYILDRFLDELPDEDDSPREQLENLVETLLPTTVSEEPYRVMLAMFELRMNAPHDTAVRDQYLAVEETITDLIEDILTRGIDAGEFEDLDTKVEAELLVSLLIGTRTRRLTVYAPEQSIEPLKTAIGAQIDRITTAECE
ncbi:TetR family transcriptional regulator [Halorhabdus sp. CBA1104]|nr:TetR family transcriptional regulator [Halorhabdus sp. CBA1104]